MYVPALTPIANSDQHSVQPITDDWSWKDELVEQWQRVIVERVKRWELW